MSKQLYLEGAYDHCHLTDRQSLIALLKSASSYALSVDDRQGSGAFIIGDVVFHHFGVDRLPGYESLDFFEKRDPRHTMSLIGSFEYADIFSDKCSKVLFLKLKGLETEKRLFLR